MVSKIWPDRFVEYVAKAMLKDSVPLDKTNKVLYAAISKIKVRTTNLVKWDWL
jgi:hypothetical protein